MSYVSLWLLLLSVSGGAKSDLFPPSYQERMGDAAAAAKEHDDDDDEDKDDDTDYETREDFLFWAPTPITETKSSHAENSVQNISTHTNSHTHLRKKKNEGEKKEKRQNWS